MKPILLALCVVLGLLTCACDASKELVLEEGAACNPDVDYSIYCEDAFSAMADACGGLYDMSSSWATYACDAATRTLKIVHHNRYCYYGCTFATCDENHILNLNTPIDFGEPCSPGSEELALCDGAGTCLPERELQAKLKNCLDVDPPSLVFGSLARGRHATQTLTLTNRCEVELSLGVGVLTASGAVSDHFSLVGDRSTTLATLVPNASLSYTIEAESLDDSFIGDLFAVSVHFGSYSRSFKRIHTIPLSINSLDTYIGVNEPNWELGQLPINRPSYRTLKVTNIRGEAILISEPSWNTEIVGCEVKKKTGWPWRLEPGEEIGIELRCLPTESGAASGFLRLVAKAEHEADYSAGSLVAVSYAGAESPLLFPDLAKLDFGVVRVGETDEASVTLLNRGPRPITLDGMILEEDVYGEFAFSDTPTFPLTLDAYGDSPITNNVTFTLAYTPKQVGVSTARLVVRAEEGKADTSLALHGLAVPSQGLR